MTSEENEEERRKRDIETLMYAVFIPYKKLCEELRNGDNDNNEGGDKRGYPMHWL